MDCLRSFTLRIQGSVDISSPQSKRWGLAPQNYWVAENGFGSTSVFNIEGFKNINIYKVVAVGNVVSDIDGVDSCIVQDWNFYVKIGGQFQPVSGEIRSSPNNFSMIQQVGDPLFFLSKYATTLEFRDPLISAKYFEVVGITANGIGAENLTKVNLNYLVNFVIYYQYEGED